MSFSRDWSRRQVLVSAVAGVAAWPVAGLAGDKSITASSSATLAASGGHRWLELFNTHTSEAVAVAFRTGAGLVQSALDVLAHVLRDHRSGHVSAMDTGLYDLLADLAVAAGAEPRFEIISGYRSPKTNARLARQSSGVAKHSLHMEGRAIDVRLKGVSCARLRDLALDAARGGVGYYRASDFVHLDTGRVRAWAG